MNLRDKLRMAGAPPKKAAAAPVFTSCWERTVLHPLDEFPGAFSLQPATVRLMEATPLPEHFLPRDILYLDTETTGLSGGAGTVAFEVGVGQLEDTGFAVTQWVMRDYPEERYLLEKLRDRLEGAAVLCTFNGRSFDIPLLRDRFLMNRMDASCLDKPHIDLLHIARRVWKLRLGRCNLGRLEQAILGMERQDDLPGSLVPQRYFDYLKSKDFSLLEPVLAHNGQDIASLCVLLNYMAEAYEHPEKLRFGADLLSMGSALERQRHGEEARRCYRLVPGGRYHAQSQLRLAESHRRAGEKAHAARIWEEMIRRHEGGVAPYIALAKYHEHVTGDVEQALTLTRKAQLLLCEPGLFTPETVQKTKNALQYRCDRLTRKAAALKGK